jgi:lipoprotein NlpD
MGFPERLLLLLCFTLILAACTDTPYYAPVFDVNTWQRKTTPVVTSVVPATKFSSPSLAQSIEWHWPVKHLKIYSTHEKGMDISGNLGEPILASAAGKVVYCSQGLKGYGNLIIIKHNLLYLSAYAHNLEVFVREGDWVKQDQKIASMGTASANRAMLHFEIRQNGQAIDPYSVLKNTTLN